MTIVFAGSCTLQTFSMGTGLHGLNTRSDNHPDTVKDRDLRAHDCKTLVCDFGCRPCQLPDNILFLQVSTRDN